MRAVGSKSYSNHFIHPNEYPDITRQSIETFEFITGQTLDNEAILVIQNMYDYIVSTVSETVVNAIIDTANLKGATQLSDYDRSDILVFLVLMAVLSGDTRDTILNWYKLTRIDDLDIDLLKEYSKLLGYVWAKSEYTDNISIDEERQRIWMPIYRQIVKDRGSSDSLKAMIKAYYLNADDYPVISNIHVKDRVATSNWKKGIELDSPYTTIEVVYDDNDDYEEVPISQSAQNNYVSILKEKINEVRPAGINIEYRRREI